MSFEQAWLRIAALAGSKFQQVRGQTFTYEVSGEYVIPSTTRVRITKRYFEKAWERMPVGGPGEINDLIAPSYLFAILTDPRIVSRS